MKSSFSNAGQNLPGAQPASPSSLQSSAVLERLTLSLIDRLPTDQERSLARSHGFKSLFEFANQLIQGKEFFDRQSMYWQAQLRQTPAWLWENAPDVPWTKIKLGSASEQNKFIWFTQSTDKGGETTCSGVWTTLQSGKPVGCSCDDSVDVLPDWDSSASMRVCPHAKQDDACGSSLQKCLPIDARLQPSNRFLAVDKESAGGRAISRLLTDLALVQGRSIALGIVSQHRWTQLINNPKTALSRSSLLLLKRWSELFPDSENPAFAINDVLKIETFSQPLKSILGSSNTTTRRYGPRLLAEAPAEELVLSNSLDSRVVLQPLRSTQLGQHVWSWNSALLLTCQIPLFAPQTFNLPLPKPEHAREGAYFCSSCHLGLDKTSSQQKQVRKSFLDEFKSLSANRDSSVKQCAVEHALQFLLGYRPSGNEFSGLRKKGLTAYANNYENIALVIRDLALELAREGDK